VAALLFVFIVEIDVEMFGDLMEVVFLALWQLDIGVLLIIIALFVVFSLFEFVIVGGIFFLFNFVFGVFFDSGGRLCILEVEFMLIIAFFDLGVEVIGPVVVVISIVGDGLVFVDKLDVALRFDVYLVVVDDGVGEEVVLVFGSLF
jgi:hypothetical protein